MLFSSLTFLYQFLPLVLLLYFIVPFRYKNFLLLLASLLFYGWSEPIYILLMLLSILVGFISGIAIEKAKSEKQAKIILILAVVFDLGMLGLFKYTDFFLSNINQITHSSFKLLNIALPVGISFYTFQILSYTVDVYRKDVPAQKNFISLATYITLFPQLIAGPIVRYKDVEKQLKKRNHDINSVSLGLRRFIIGLSKKILIANQLGEFCSLFQTSQEKTFLFYWLYAIAYMFQIYFDFSGYSDMAIGLGKIFGFDFIENFNYPYISRSITEFWRRWHISLGSWFRDYVYIPLGGNRVSKLRNYFNILVVWMLTGFWHGASWNFILWGLYFAILLVIEKKYLLPILKQHPILSHVYVLFFVLISFVIFNATDLSSAASVIQGMFNFNFNISFAETIYYLRSYLVLFLFACIASTPILKIAYQRLENSRLAVLLNIIEPICLIILLLICTAYLVDGSFNPFLYFRF